MHLDTAGLGRRHDLAGELDALGDPTLTAGRVLAQHRGRWLVAENAGAAERGPGDPRLLPARGRLRETPPVTGDWVAIDPDGAIAAVLERRGTIVRLAADVATAPQVLAANVDLALLVEPAPQPNERRLERLLALAAADGVPVTLVLTKADLDPEAQLTAAQVARRLGVVAGIAVSALERDGVSTLRALLEPGATAVLLGASGAGKSTLVNALLGEERQATRPVRAGDGRGRHTTVTRALIPLPGGALLLDTPGLRKVGLWDGSGSAFADIDTLARECHFRDCHHETEPGCAVRDAVEPERLGAWRKLTREQAWLDDRKAAAREREQRGRTYPAIQRAARRMKGER
jgi:ribosome biogenesis GTPase / thiamine phosphate phosphatase